jgi:hypothetical protein
LLPSSTIAYFIVYSPKLHFTVRSALPFYLDQSWS